MLTSFSPRGANMQAFTAVRPENNRWPALWRMSTHLAVDVGVLRRERLALDNDNALSAFRTPWPTLSALRSLSCGGSSAHLLSALALQVCKLVRSPCHQPSMAPAPDGATRPGTLPWRRKPSHVGGEPMFATCPRPPALGVVSPAPSNHKPKRFKTGVGAPTAAA